MSETSTEDLLLEQMYLFHIDVLAYKYSGSSQA